jgi:hypothetical protein
MVIGLSGGVVARHQGIQVASSAARQVHDRPAVVARSAFEEHGIDRQCQFRFPRTAIVARNAQAVPRARKQGAVDRHFEKQIEVVVDTHSEDHAFTDVVKGRTAIDRFQQTERRAHDESVGSPRNFVDLLAMGIPAVGRGEGRPEPTRETRH